VQANVHCTLVGRLILKKIGRSLPKYLHHNAQKLFYLCTIEKNRGYIIPLNIPVIYFSIARAIEIAGGISTL
jgi:hypothetical protein